MTTTRKHCNPTNNFSVTGSGTETPAGETADKLYTPTDPGIQVNIYSGDLSGYKIPGPALFSGASSGSGSSSGSGTSAAAPAASSPATSAAAATSSAAVQNNAVSSSVAAVPTATSVAASPSAPAETGSAGLPKEFTIDTFITWLQEEAGSSSSAKARRHARSFRG